MWRSCEQERARTGKKTRPNSTITFRLAPAGRACRDWEKISFDRALKHRGCLSVPGDGRVTHPAAATPVVTRFTSAPAVLPRRCHYGWALVPLSLPAALTLDRWEDCPAIAAPRDAGRNTSERKACHASSAYCPPWSCTEAKAGLCWCAGEPLCRLFFKKKAY